MANKILLTAGIIREYRFSSTVHFYAFCEISKENA